MKLGKVGIVVAARTNSSRLPGKALKPLQGRPMVIFLLERLKSLQSAQVILATTTLASDNQLAETVAATGVPVFRGHPTDLVARHAALARQHGFDMVGRVTADCPFVDAEMVDHCLQQAAQFDSFDLASTKGAFPVGLDIELLPTPQLDALDHNPALTEEHREHLTLFLYGKPGQFTVRTLQPRNDWRIDGATFTVDTAEDYQKAVRLADSFPSPLFSLQNLIARAAT